MILYASLAIMALLAAGLVYRYDMYDREPWPVLLLAMAAGAGLMWTLGFVEDWSIERFGGLSRTPIVISAVAATHEETARLIVVLLIAILLPRLFNDPMDGIIYGSIVGLGMAVQESLFFMRLWQTPEGFIPATELVRLMGHLVMGGITGYGVGMARVRAHRWLEILLACYVASMGLHFLWDWLAITSGRAASMTRLQTLAAIAIMLSGLILYGALVTLGSARSRAAFAPDARRSLWGWPLSLFLRRS